MVLDPGDDLPIRGKGGRFISRKNLFPVLINAYGKLIRPIYKSTIGLKSKGSNQRSESIEILCIT
jgi:hypothetical protein